MVVCNGIISTNTIASMSRGLWRRGCAYCNGDTPISTITNMQRVYG